MIVRGHSIGRLGKRLIALGLALVIIPGAARPVQAVTLTEIQKQKEEAQQEKKNTQKQLESVQAEINSIKEERESAEAEIEEIDAELVDVLLSIDILDQDIANKKVQVEEAQKQLEEAVAKEESQQLAMKRRIKFMYEKGETSYLSLLLASASLAEAVNKQDYTEKLYSYDRTLLEEYQNTRHEVAHKKESLETELSELEEIEQDFTEQKESLQSMIDERQEVLDNFDEKLSNAKNKANDYKAQINEQAKQIKQIEQAENAVKAAEIAKKQAEENAKRRAEEEARRKAQEENGEENQESVSEAYTPEPASPGDSSKGQEIANYACQFVGNPYVAGGTSLTEGCDCSGFTSSVFSHFGISLPRSSYAQSAAGRAVSFAEIQPGDILYYGGHVAIYIGNNQIVHASTAATGIKISNASYRTVITIRRFV